MRRCKEEYINGKKLYGYIDSQFNLGYLYGYKYFSSDGQDYDINLAIKGDADAQYRLGNYHSAGQNVEQSLVKAVYWFAKSAEQGNVDALYKLFCCCVKSWWDVSVYLYTKSAEQGNVEAQYELARCYYFGNGVAQSYNQAVYWYTKSAEQGNVEAQYELARCYYFGNGVVQSCNEAVYYSSLRFQDCCILMN